MCGKASASYISLQDAKEADLLTLRPQCAPQMSSLWLGCRLENGLHCIEYDTQYRCTFKNQDSAPR
ncbi:hypothetical protein FGW84_04500 [Xylella fastidiosa subsp. multiplex]|nr:hypothetical protein [Xylella fastidiosa subsp. multiplex]MRT54106.1 hypothetical protein [Xylella fastidiosa subsp. multiplex]MRU30510.1 hypothetical protein [Xylella fastidiosa subsp. multiplex]